MIDRAVNLIFIDFFSLAINITLGAVLRSKICNYSWDCLPEKENKDSQESISTELWEQEEEDNR